MEHGKVIDEVHVAGHGLDLKAILLGDGLDVVECLKLILVDCREASRAGMGNAADERGATKVGDEPTVLAEDDGAALKARPGH